MGSASACSGPDVQLNPGKFNDWLTNIGQTVTWRRARTCQCTSPNSGAAKVNCPVCAGKRVFWDPGVSSIVGIAGQQIQRKWAQMGHWEDGDAVVTIPENSAMYDCGQFDRVLMLNSTDRFSYALARGAPNERVFVSVEAFERVFWLTNGNLPIVDGDLPTIDANGFVSWAHGAVAPPVGTVYTVEGTRYAEYFVYSALPSDRAEHQGARLPKKIVLRSFDLFAR